MVSVEGVQLDSIFDSSKHDILLMKVDVEGFESRVFVSAKNLIENGAVRNLIFEINVPMMSKSKGGYEVEKRRLMNFIKWFMEDLGYQSKVSLRGSWTHQSPMNVKDWVDLLREPTFTTGDCWFYKPSK